jgi:hypothetical protein
MENPVPNDTQQWLIMAAIVQIVCSAIVAIVSLITQKKVDDNTELTKKASDKADVAAGKATKAHAVGIENLKVNRETAGKIKETEKKIEELQGESGLLKRQNHFEGDEETKDK